jgi:hypothetical protein
MKITITQPSLPLLEEFIPYLEDKRFTKPNYQMINNT